MNEKTKKILIYGTIGVAILILLFLYFRKKQPEAQTQGKLYPITPASFQQTQMPTFQGISLAGLEYQKFMTPIFEEFLTSITFKPITTTSCGFCPPSNKLDNYIWQ